MSRLPQFIRRVLGLIPYPLYSRALAARDVVKGMPDPVLIYQMGKVGSSSVREMLERAGVRNIHVHLISRSARIREAAFRRKMEDGVPPHIYKGGIVDWWLHNTAKQVRVITLVRDPVASHISGEFELAHVTGFPAGNVQRSVDRLVRDLEGGALDEPFGWFESEFSPTVELDFFAHPFDREAGWTRITTPRFDILALTLERLDALSTTVLSEFVGTDLQPQVARQRTDDVYGEVKRRVKLSAATLDRIYEHRRVQHFYSAARREQFRARWLA